MDHDKELAAATMKSAMVACERQMRDLALQDLQSYRDTLSKALAYAREEVEIQFPGENVKMPAAFYADMFKQDICLIANEAARIQKTYGIAEVSR